MKRIALYCVLIVILAASCGTSPYSPYKISRSYDEFAKDWSTSLVLELEGPRREGCPFVLHIFTVETEDLVAYSLMVQRMGYTEWMFIRSIEILADGEKVDPGVFLKRDFSYDPGYREYIQYVFPRKSLRAMAGARVVKIRVNGEWSDVFALTEGNIEGVTRFWSATGGM